MNITQPNPEQPLYVVSDIISDEDLNFLRKIFTGLKDPVFNKQKTDDLIKNLQDKIKSVVKEVYPNLGDARWSKQADIMICEEGFEMAVQWNGVLKSVTNEQVNAMTMLFINDNFSGGNYYFPEIDYTYSPKAGDLVIHPGGEPFGNGLSKVSGGTQVILTMMGFLEK